MAQNHLKTTFAFIGSYADKTSSGVYSCSFNPETGELSLLDQISGLQNPTFVEVDSNRRKLYALSEGVGAEGQRVGAAVSFHIDPNTGSLSFLNEELTVDASTCHIVLDQSGQCLIVSSYHGGMIGVLPVLEDGQIAPTSDVHQHTGSSVLPVQSQARPHSVFLDRSNRFALASDLGLDKILIYKLDSNNHKLNPQGEIQVAAGAGPRHFAFHPQGRFGYVINELNSTITAFSFDEELGKLTEIHTVSTLPELYEGDNACADIHISPDGKFLYGSNRGHDSIAVYQIDEATGELSLVEHTSTQGGHPRNFVLSQDGRFLLVANRDSNNIVTFARDSNSGRLEATGSQLDISKPVCIKIASLG